LKIARLRRLSRDRQDKAIPQESSISPLNLPGYVSEKKDHSSYERVKRFTLFGH